MKRTVISQLMVSAAILGMTPGVSLAQNRPSVQEQARAQEEAVAQLEARIEQASSALDQDNEQQAEQNLQEAWDLLQSALEETEGRDRTQLQRIAQEIRQASDVLDENEPQRAEEAVSEARDLIAEVQSGNAQRAPQGAQAANEDPAITVREQTAQVVIEQPPPQIIVQQPAPRITIEIPQPRIIVRMPDAQVRVEQTGNANVQTPATQPQIEYQMEEPQIEVIRGQGSPDVTIERQARFVEQNAVQQNLPQQASQQRAAESNPTRSISVEELKEMAVVDANGEEIGEVARVVRDASGRYFIVANAGGFFGIGAEEVPIAVNRIRVRDEELVLATLSQNEIESMGEVDLDVYQDARPQARVTIEVMSTDSARN